MYQHPHGSQPPVFEFEEMTEEEVRKQIKQMNTKHCELDPIPTHLFKDLLLGTISIVTKVVNLSLTLGRFSRHWKVALVRPLLKKSWTQTYIIKL